MDPFAIDDGQKEESLHILERSVRFADRLQQSTGKIVPVVGSFSIVHGNLKNFYKLHEELLSTYHEQGVQIMMQWLPPFAWYFGGSVRLDVMNDLEDVDYLKNTSIEICMDFCHLLLGKNLSGFDSNQILNSLQNRIKHIHIADAIGIDGEGIAFGEGETENINIIGKAFEYKCIKVIEVWQGHLDNGAGFRNAISSLRKLYA